MSWRRDDDPFVCAVARRERADIVRAVPSVLRIGMPGVRALATFAEPHMRSHWPAVGIGFHVARAMWTLHAD
jgi:hypothetical protein